jgi:hypothetical protein
MVTVAHNIASNSRSSDQLCADLLRELRDDANQNAPTSQIEVLAIIRRPVCDVYRLRVRSGGGQRLVRAKQYRDWRREPDVGDAHASDPPRLFLPPAVDDKAPFEYRALAAIYEQFSDGDWRFGRVRPLALLPSDRTVVLEELPLQGVDAALSRRRFFRSGRARPQLETALRNAGAWLHRFHRMPLLAHTRRRHASRDEFVKSLDSAALYLQKNLGRTSAVDRLIDRARCAASGALPSDLPLGLNHGDFAPRNLLLSDDGRVHGIDTLARWEAPIYEDIGHFLAALETTEMQMFSQGLWIARAELDRHKRAFVEGYFGQAVPWEAVRLFELQALLYRWASAAQGMQESTGVRRLLKQARFTVRNRFFNQYARRLMEGS